MTDVEYLNVLRIFFRVILLNMYHVSEKLDLKMFTSVSFVGERLVQRAESRV